MKIAKLMALVAGGTLLAGSVQAVPISAGISLAGNYTVNTGNLNTATAFSTFSSVQVTSDSGSFAIAGVILNTIGSVNMTPFSFNPFPGGGVIPLWSTTAGPAASFDLTTLSSRLQPGDDTLTLKGTGMLHLVGFDNTPGSWTFTANQAQATFSWSSSNGALPDGGTTVMLLGSALAALGMARRYFKA